MCNICGFTIGIGVVVRAEITIATDMLETAIYTQEVFVVSGEHIPFEGCGIDIVSQLFAERRLMWLYAINAISATAILGGLVVQQ